jgi:hypothetical protein
MSQARRPAGVLASVAFLAAATLLAAAEPVGAETPSWNPPKTPWGEPDLRGMWPIGHLTGTPLQRPPQYGDRLYLTDEEMAQKEQRLAAQSSRYASEEKENKLNMGHWAETGEPNRLTSLIVEPKNGRIPPFTPEGQRISDSMRSSWHDITWDWVDDFDSWDRCITRGMPGSMLPFMYNNGIQIFQSPGYVIVDLEMVHEARVIPTDNRPAAPAAIQEWMGESRGHWEGNTLVVVTTNLKAGTDATNEKPGKHPVSPATRITERFTRTGPDAIDYEMTFEDPVLYAGAWTVKMPWKRDPAYAMYEYACHEGNEIIPNYIHASRAKRAAEQAAKQGAGR